MKHWPQIGHRLSKIIKNLLHYFCGTLSKPKLSKEERTIMSESIHHCPLSDGTKALLLINVAGR